MEQTTSKRSEHEAKRGNDSLMETTPDSSPNKSGRNLQNEDITPKQRFLPVLHLKHVSSPHSPCRVTSSSDYSTFDCTLFADSDSTDVSDKLRQDKVETEDQGNEPDSKYYIDGSCTPFENGSQEMSCLSQQNDVMDNTIDSTTLSPTELMVNQPSCSSEEQNINPVEEIKNSQHPGKTVFRKITTAIASSWTLAKKMLSDSLGRKRVDLGCSDVGVENKPPEKMMRVGDTTCPDLSSLEADKLPVKWECPPKPISIYNYKIRARRPLPQMRKSP